MILSLYWFIIVCVKKRVYKWKYYVSLAVRSAQMWFDNSDCGMKVSRNIDREKVKTLSGRKKMMQKNIHSHQKTTQEHSNEY